MKFSKIFNKDDGDGKERPKDSVRQEKIEARQEAARDSEAIVSSELHRGALGASSSKAGELYSEAVAKAKVIYSPDTELKAQSLTEVDDLVKRLIAFLRAGGMELHLLSLQDYPDNEELLYYHIVNVCIFSIVTGIGLGYDDTSLLELGVASFLHDIGIKSFDAVHKKEMLEKEDYGKILQHPQEGVKILNEIFKDLSPKILEAVAQEHERADGSGYPKGLVKEDISEYAQVVGLADVYEALMHGRPYRDKYTSLEAMQVIIKNKTTFHSKLIKSLIEGMGMYPVGTMVRLNTKEIGVVTKNNIDFPARPIVDIVLDSYGKELKQPRQVNLAENTVVFIEDCYKEGK